MRHNALGLIEVRGYLGAIAAADAALKAAHVTCLGIERVKDGFRMIKLSGDVGAVQSAVDAGAEVAVQLDVLVTRHVIARMHEETAAMVLGSDDASNKQATAVKVAAGAADQDAAAPSKTSLSVQAEEASAQMTAGAEETSSTLENTNAPQAAKASSDEVGAETSTTKHQEHASNAIADAATSVVEGKTVDTNTKELTSLIGKQGETTGKPEAKLEVKPAVAPVKPTAPSAAKRSKHKKKASS